MKILNSPYIQKLFKLLKNAEIHYLVSSLSYTTLLSIVPLVALVLSIAQGFGLMDSAILQLKPLIYKYLAAGTGEQLVEWIEASARKINTGALGSSGAIVLVFISTKLFYDIDVAVQKIWGLRQNRGFAKRLMFYWLALLAAPILLVAPVLLQTLEALRFVPEIVSSSLSTFIFFIPLFAINHWLPNRRVKWKFSVAASLSTGIALTLFSKVYAWASINLLYYSKVYGSLTSMFLFLVWLTIFWYAIFAGVLLCASFHKQESPT